MFNKLNLQTLTQDSLQWHPATWDEYLAYRDDDNNPERVKLFFNNGYLFVDMGSEGPSHSIISDLFTFIFVLWFRNKPDQSASSRGRCLLEKPGKQAASPDLVLYIGEGFPEWQIGEPRRIDLSKWRVPDLIGEVADTTLASDLNEKKLLYAELELPEYWVIDVKKKQVIAFRLQENKKYQQCDRSVALEGLPISLLQQTLERLDETKGDNISVALWFDRQISEMI